MNAKHTPGPWSLRRHQVNHQTVTGATAGLIADIHKDEDAYLIAAAPDLLAALRDLERAVHFACSKQSLTSRKEDHVKDCMEALKVCDIARAAIAKAEGQQ